MFHILHRRENDMLELKDGGKYVNRLGEVVTVHDDEWCGRYPFYHEDDNGVVTTYKSNGCYFDICDPNDLDLVAEYKEHEDFISKAALAKYIRNKLAVLAVLTESDDIHLVNASEHSMETLLALCDEFGIVLYY